MSDVKIVNYIEIPLETKSAEVKRTCFIVYSSREPHIEIILDAIESVLESTNKYDVKRLATHGVSGYSQYSQLISFLNSCALAIIILDGFRPNVLFEYGILVGLNKPCIVLIEENATIDMQSFAKDKKPTPLNVKIDMDKDFSDVKDQLYLRYKYADPKKLRSLLNDELDKLESVVESTFMKIVFPEKELLESELSASLATFSHLNYREESFCNDDEIQFRVCVSEIERVSNKHGIKLTPLYFYQKINILMKLQNHKEALQVIDSLLEVYNSDINLLLFKSNALSELKKYELALNTLNAAIKIDSKSDVIWHCKALLLERMKRMEEAKLCYEKGIEFNKDCSSIHYNYGVLLLDFNLREALKQFNKALELRPSDDTYMVFKANTLYDLGKIKEAIKVIKDALCINENNADAWFGLGRFTEKFSDAITYYDKCLSFRSTHTGALCSKGASLTNLDRSGEAIEYLNKATKLCKKYKNNSCGIIEWNLGKTKFEIHRSGNDPGNNIVKESLKHFIKSLTFDAKPNDTTYEYLAYINLILRNTKEARKYLDMLFNKDKELDLSTMTLLYDYAIAEVMEGEFCGAKNRLNQLLEITKAKKLKDRTCYCLLIPTLANDEIDFTEVSSPDLVNSIKVAINVLDSIPFIH